jgi:hypothetical protein
MTLTLTHAVKIESEENVAWLDAMLTLRSAAQEWREMWGQAVPWGKRRDAEHKLRAAVDALDAMEDRLRRPE